MITTAIIVTVLFAPPSNESFKRDRVQQISDMAADARPAGISAFTSLLTRELPSWERIVVIKMLKPYHRTAALRAVKRLMKHPDIHVRTEATIRSHQWSPTSESLKALETFRSRGVNLRRAFQTGEVRGRPTYRADGPAFFLGSMSHSNVYSRLDGALGLVEQGDEPAASVAIGVFEAILKEGSVNERRLAVHHMYTSFREPRFVPLVKLASDDPDETVSRLATTLLSRL
ncbi:MAG: hypothetical protein VX223_04055 [Myxococcota bacterium]|nr:hypothetical protein [Myxococcota bacterium]